MQAKKIIIYAIAGLLAIFFLKSVFGSFRGKISHSSKMIEEKRDVTSFSGISASNAIEVELIKSDVEKIELKAGENSMNDIITEVNDGILKIYVDADFYKSYNPIEAKVYYKNDLHKIKASSASNIKANDTLYTDKIDIKASSSGSVKLLLIANSTNVDASSAGTINLQGSSAILEAESSSGSTLKLKKFEVNTCTIKSSSGSSAEIRIKNELNAKASSGAEIEYTGSPATINKNEDSGANIESSND